MAHTECDSLYFDLDTGMINSVSPSLPPMDIKEWFTCYTKEVPEGASHSCGGGILYEKHGFYYYTYFDVVEVDTLFKGKMTGDLMNSAKEKVYATIGQPLILETTRNPDIDFFNRKFGCLVVRYHNGKVFKVSAHNQDCNFTVVCDEDAQDLK